MCKCAEGFKCESDQSRLEQQHKEANELLNMYRELALAQEVEIERLHNGIDALQRKLLIGEYTEGV